VADDINEKVLISREMSSDPQVTIVKRESNPKLSKLAKLNPLALATLFA
jgi:hypothetical protein